MEVAFSQILEVCILFAFAFTVVLSPGAGDQRVKNKGLTGVNDMKEWKHLLKTKTNVLVYFGREGLPKTNTETYKVLQQAAETVRGFGTIVTVDCTTKEGKKLCKKGKVDGPSFLLKHYHNGDFNKDYDRAIKVSSVVNFMKDPTGDLPWEEDPTTAPIHHLPDPTALLRLLKTEKESSKGILVLFYAPWCGFCKKMKPDFVEAAGQLKGEAILAAIDVNRPENSELRKKYNITGFPTLLYFRSGHLKRPYDGENTKDAIVSFLRDPDAPPVEKPKEIHWSEEPSQVVHLTSSTFDEFVQKTPSVLVMFYAPWCGHCKKMKPEYTAAAQKLKDLGVEGILAAVDATQEVQLGQKFDVKGYPTIKYFRNGAFAFNAENVRDEERIVAFMEDPKEPPPPPPPEKPWSDEPSAVVHLDEESFESVLKEKAHALIMFYAPWCGHCKAAKPELTAAAEELKENTDVLFGAVDCTVEKVLCKAYDIKGFPTFKHFRHFNLEKMTPYEGGRTKQDFSNEVAPPAGSSKTFYPDWQGIQGNENIHKLTDENIADFIKKQESTLVMFYAPWCGHCKAMKPDYARAAAALARDSPKSTLAALDCVQYPHAMERYKIDGYPTLKYYKNGNYVKDYNGHRRTTEFINFMIRGRDEL